LARVPDAGCERRRRIVAEGPVEGQRARATPAALDVESPASLRTGHGSRGAIRPVDRHPALELEEIAGREIDEQQAGPRVAQQIAERVEVAVAAEIGNRQR